MNQLIIDIIKRELLTSRSYIPLLKPISFDIAIIGCYENVAANIEFTLLDSKLKEGLQEGIFNVFLDDYWAFEGTRL